MVMSPGVVAEVATEQRRLLLPLAAAVIVFVGLQHQLIRLGAAVYSDRAGSVSGVSVTSQAVVAAAPFLALLLASVAMARSGYRRAWILPALLHAVVPAATAGQTM